MLREDDKERPVEKVNAITGICQEIEDGWFFLSGVFSWRMRADRIMAQAAIVAAKKPNR